jgi:hypothetical protein
MLCVLLKWLKIWDFNFLTVLRSDPEHRDTVPYFDCGWVSIKFLPLSFYNVACCGNVIMVCYISVVYHARISYIFTTLFWTVCHMFSACQSNAHYHILWVSQYSCLLQNVGMSWWLGGTVTHNLNDMVHVSSGPSCGVYACHDRVMRLLSHDSRDARWHGQIVRLWLGWSAALPCWTMGWQTMCEAGWTWCCISVSHGCGRRPATPFSPDFLVDAAVTHKWLKICWCIGNVIL